MSVMADGDKAGKQWRPDADTVQWALQVLDDDAIGSLIKDQMPRDLAELPVSNQQLGEAAIEAVLFSVLNRVDEAKATPPDQPVHGSIVHGQDGPV